MNVKRGLENRIRGWFPQEPAAKLPLTANNRVNYASQTRMSTKAQPLSAARVALFIPLVLMCSLLLIPLRFFSFISTATGLASVIGAVAIGLAIGVVPTVIDLKKVQKYGEANQRNSFFAMIAYVSLVICVVLASFIGHNLWMGISAFQSAIMIFAILSMLALGVSKAVLMLVWQARSESVLMVDKFRLFALTKNARQSLTISMR